MYDKPEGSFIDDEHWSFHNEFHVNIPQKELTGADKFILKKIEVYLVK